ncbi:hypothetical protein HK105_204554 [Polyrhizophydium stewartii]|uniref:Uncharacterized protein n=1 Tax=Polyrhizophydium stewartii TaxID=2732419 RepID=A0ABR4N8K9_9FUNG
MDPDLVSKGMRGSMLLQLAVCVGVIAHHASTQPGVYDTFSGVWIAALQLAATAPTVVDFWVLFSGRHHTSLLWAHLITTVVLGIAMCFMFEFTLAMAQGACAAGITAFSCSTLTASAVRSAVLWVSQALTIWGVTEHLLLTWEPARTSETGKVVPA